MCSMRLVAPEPEAQKASVWIAVKLLAVPLAAALLTALEESGFGYWIGLMVIPTLVALLVVRFKPAKKMRTFSNVFCLVGLIGIGSMTTSHMQDLASQQKTVKQIAQEAAGIK